MYYTQMGNIYIFVVTSVSLDMIDKEKFFINENSIEYISEEEYMAVNSIIEDVKAFARTTYKSVYVIYYYRQCFLYVSENPLFLCGLDADSVKNMGYNFYIKHASEEDLSMLLEINSAGFRFFGHITIDKRKEFVISCDFSIVNKMTNRKTLINHQITPLRITDDGKIWLGLCVASMATSNKSGNIFIQKSNSSECWNYNLITKRWKLVTPVELNDIEKEVLRLSAMGFTMHEIAAGINRSFDSVKRYRKNILEKLGVSNIVEAVNYAEVYKLL